MNKNYGDMRRIKDKYSRTSGVSILSREYKKKNRRAKEIMLIEVKKIAFNAN